MEFRIWAEVTFDPSITHLYKRQFEKPSIGASYSLKIDPSGKIVPLSDEDWKQSISFPHFEIIPRAKEINLQKLSPISPDFRKFINALREKYPDIDRWDVNVFGQAGHMQTGRKSWNRTVAYWMQQPSVDLRNKLPVFFYHGTSTNLWYDGIKKTGLMPRKMSGQTGSYGAQNVSSLSQSDLVYLSVHPDAGTREAARQAAKKHGGRPLILRIDSNALMPEKFIPDEDTRSTSPQESIRRMSVIAYRGRIGPSAIKPYLMGEEISDKNRIYFNWERFKDVPVEEHPVTKAIKNKMLPYHDSPEYYALKDAGILDTEEYYDDNGFRHTKMVQKRDASDEEIRKILRKSGWTQNVRAIISDLNSGYNGALYALKGKEVPEHLSKEEQKIIEMLIESGILNIQKSGEYRYFDVMSWNSEKYALKLAKLMGKMDFRELADKIRAI